MSENNLPLWIWIGLVLVVLWAREPVLDQLNDRITVYPASCVDEPLPEHPYVQCSKWEALPSAAFMVNQEQQFVVHKSSFIRRLNNCVVFDRLNWVCSDYHAYDGRVVPSSLDSMVRFQSRLGWYWLKYF